LPHRFIEDLQPGDAVKQFFLLRRVDSRLTKKGKPYLDVELTDRSGALKGKVWDDVLKKCPEPLAACDFVAVTGVVEAFEGTPQLNLTFIDTVARLKGKGRPVQDFDPDLLIPVTPHDREALWGELLELVNAHINTPLRELVLAILTRYEAQLRTWPGAVFYHHAYAGGLLEHTCSVARHAARSLEVYPAINGDLLMAGAILHDLGKLKEYTGPPCPERSVPGELLGHIVLGWEMIREEARALGFPDEQLLMSLEHIVISHHGALEFGSPSLPRTPEALLVYYLDEIDAKLHMALHHLDNDPGAGDFTSYLKGLGRRLYRPPGPAADSPESPPSDDS
jgi:3'-5' exoribonuclease